MAKIVTAIPRMIFHSILGKGEDAPAIEPPKPMPEADSESVDNTRRRAALALQQTKGRASTMLSSDNPDALGNSK